MSINIDNFKDLLSAHDIRYRQGGKSLTLNFCPECSSKKFKVAFALSTTDSGLLGKCFRGSCGAGFSAYKYLKLLDCTEEEIETVTGMGTESSINYMINEVKDELFDVGTIKNLKTEEVKVVTKFDGSQFIGFKAIPNNPITKYAISRGVDIDTHSDTIKACMDTNAVVFLCGEVGWQKRFIKPNNPKVKTLTMPGFDAHDNIIVLENGNKDVWICEGPFTAVAAWNYGFTGVCTFGAGISSQQLEKIKKISLDKGIKIGICFDMDEAGDKGVNKILKFFYGYDDMIYRVVPEEGNDLSESWEKGKKYNVLDVKGKDPSVPELMF